MVLVAMERNDPEAWAGRSLQNEYDRRMAERQDRVNERFPRLGRLLLAVFDEADATRAFKKGAEGERKAVKRILEQAGDSVLLMVNRRLGQSRRDGDIDIVAVTAAGVHVIDVKHYKNAKVRVERTGGLFSPRVEKLYVRGRDATNLVDKLEKQVSAVRAALRDSESFAAVPIYGAICFVDADLALLGSREIRAIRCLGSKETGRWLRDASGQYSDSDRDILYEHLHKALPPATSG